MGSPGHRENLVLLAKQAESFREMVDAMKGVALLHVDLTVEERGLLYCGYKRMVDFRRDWWRFLRRNQGEEAKKLLAEVELELSNICVEFLRVIDDHLIPYSSFTESTILYYRLKGDFYRYIAEIKGGNVRDEIANHSLTAYMTATAMAEAALSPAHPILLAVAMNFAVFYHDIVKSPLRARNLVQQAVNEALPELYTLDEESYRVSLSPLQLLRRSIDLWDHEIPAIIEFVDGVGDLLNVLGQAVSKLASSAYLTHMVKNVIVLFFWPPSLW
ncbi:hypothetical protein Nepgr_004377 [Nepenthes gracilis]|uniref:14-3-3 domain-containing protein n=1 Tax=Nepenthes gracilis TaxID=150966 RepID=A0AAD3S1B3_NEPGR|nr:hypothetical protein Nepgr_004377 [Nepenthes gracilis]